MGKERLKLLVDIVEEMNKVFELDSAGQYKTKGLDVEGLEDIVKVNGSNIREDDKFGDEAKAVFRQLGVGPWLGEAGQESTPAEPENKSDKGGKGTVAKTAAAKKAEKAAAAKKAADNKAAAKAPDKTEKKKAEPKPKKEAGPKRIDAATETIKKLCGRKSGATLPEILEASNALHVKRGGKDNPNATNLHSYVLAGLVAFDVATKTGKSYKLNA